MTIIHSDPAGFPAWDFDEASQLCLYEHYPPYTATYLRDFLAHLVSVSAGNPVSVATSLNDPGLYTLAAALGSGVGDDLLRPDDNLRDTIIAELRWRNCKGMGADPRGPMRRGRLVQIIATCTPLTIAGASSLQRHNMVGGCPFCRAPDFRVFLPSVSWRCFACDRRGALLEFAEQLLRADPSNRRTQPEVGTLPLP